MLPGCPVPDQPGHEIAGRTGRELGAIAGLGLTSLASYGAFFYAYGVLVEAIEADAGWSASVLGATYAAATLLVGAFAAPAGRLLDRRGAPVALALGGIVGGGLFTAAAAAPSAVVFAALYALGGGIVGSLGFYHVTMAASARVGLPEHRPRNIALLTIVGAFASAIYLPVAAWLVEGQGWRATQAWMGGSLVVAFLAGGLLARDVRSVEVDPAATPAHPMAVLRAAAARPVVRRMLQAEAVAGIGIGIMLVHQVPAMVDAGLAFTTAAGIAGARGLLQLLGRIPLSPVVARTGTHAALVGAFVLVSASGLLLLGSGSLVVAGLFALVAGVALGAMSPLSGLYAQELFDHDHLGMLMGARAMVRQVFWAMGPLLGGIVVDRTDSQTGPVTMIAVTGALAALLLARPVAADAPDAPGEDPGIPRDPSGTRASAGG